MFNKWWRLKVKSGKGLELEQTSLGIKRISYQYYTELWPFLLNLKQFKKLKCLINDEMASSQILKSS
jgi:hypothetical protein